MTITPETTLAELDLARMQLGITAIFTQLKTSAEGDLLVEVTCISDDGLARGTGRSLAEALSIAFQSSQRKIAEQLGLLPKQIDGAIK